MCWSWVQTLPPPLASLRVREIWPHPLTRIVSSVYDFFLPLVVSYLTNWFSVLSLFFGDFLIFWRLARCYFRSCVGRCNKNRIWLGVTTTDISHMLFSSWCTLSQGGKSYVLIVSSNYPHWVHFTGDWPRNPTRKI